MILIGLIRDMVGVTLFGIGSRLMTAHTRARVTCEILSQVDKMDPDYAREND